MGVAVLVAETKRTRTEVAGGPDILPTPARVWCVAFWKFLSKTSRSQTVLKHNLRMVIAVEIDRDANLGISLVGRLHDSVEHGSSGRREKSGDVDHNLVLLEGKNDARP
jgi:hypothetical protein